MCEYFIDLAVSSEYRFVVQCEHVTIHLHWDFMTVYQNADEFEQLVSLLKQCMKIPSEFDQIEQGHCRLVYQEGGQFQIWVGNVALSLSTIELVIITSLTNLAHRKLEHLREEYFIDEFDWSSEPLLSQIESLTPKSSNFLN